MNLEPADPLGAAILLGAAFERRGISYAIGGALAYGLWGVPRATLDVDVNVFTPLSETSPVFDALSDLGIVVERENAMEAAEEQGLFMARFGMFRVDLFTPSIEFCREAERTRVLRMIDDTPLWFLSAEAIAVFKLLFFPGKDLVDLENLLVVRRGRLDSAYIRRQLVQMMGEDDERVSRWDALVASTTRQPGEPA